MNRPCTENPASRSNRAATAGSTPPDMPTMTVPSEGEFGLRLGIRPLYGQCASLALHEHLPHLRFLHARLPHFIEEVQVAAHDGRIVHVGYSIPAIRL